MIPDLTNATAATCEWYALPEDIRTAAEELAGPLRPMTHIEVLLAIGAAIVQERERDARLPIETAPNDIPADSKPPHSKRGRASRLPTGKRKLSKSSPAPSSPSGSAAPDTPVPTSKTSPAATWMKTNPRRSQAGS